MLTRTTASEVLASADQELGLRIRFAINNKIGIRPQIVEESIGKTSSFQRLQELLRDDHVGIHILNVQWGRDALDSGEFHYRGWRRSWG